MHIMHVTALVAHLQPLTMEAWGQVYLQLSLVNTFLQKVGPSEAAVTPTHGFT